MSKKIPKQYLLSEEEKLDYIKNLSKADIWDFNYTDTSKIEWETKALLAEGRKSIEETKAIIAKMTDNGMDTSEAESKLKFYQECIDGFQEVEESNRKIVKDRNTKLMQIISNSDYKIDDDGVPSNIKPNRKELIEMFCEPKMLEKYKKGFENKVFPEGITLDGLVEYEWKMQKVPLAVDMIMSKLGEDWKKQVTNLQKKLDNAKLKVASAKKGKKYPNEQTYLICDALEVYWNDNLPFDKELKFLHNRQTWFQKLADEFKMSFKSIERIERDNRPKRFTPSRTK